MPEPARILVVDDEAPLMEALRNIVEGGGHAAVGFTSPHLALEALRESRFDVLLTDLTMPGMDGIALLQAALETDPDLVGVIMSGSGTIEKAVEGMKVGALDYVLKPFDASVILPVLARALATRKLRIENAELQDRLRARTAELEATNKELEAFSYSVSHDLRAPLRLIDGFAEILVSEHTPELSADALDLVGRITANVSRMESLIDALLRFSRAGRQAVVMRPVRMAAVIRDTLDSVRRSYAPRRVDVKVGEVPDTVGDEALLRQVFVNLFSNAFKFTSKRDHPTVEVGSTTQDGDLVCFVRDNGVGFDMAYARRLFGVFQRMHRPDDFEGTGIGLALVQRIVHRHGGRVWAEAKPGEGACFYFALPHTLG